MLLLAEDAGNRNVWRQVLTPDSTKVVEMTVYAITLSSKL